MDYPINASAALMVFLLAQQPVSEAADSGDTVESDTPSLELLEFLGSFETDSGIWVDPADLMRPEFEALYGALSEDGHIASEQDDPGTDDPDDGNGT
jgi:hypothetical protein